jgi:hypothetical protein
MIGKPNETADTRKAVDTSMSTIHVFFENYRTAFVHYDHKTLAGLFAFPLQVITATENAPVISVAGQGDWSHTLGRLFHTYRMLGVADALPLELEIVGLTPYTASARVHWELRRDDGNAIYDFTAVYAIVNVAGSWRVAGIIHDEASKLQAAIHQ